MKNFVTISNHPCGGMPRALTASGMEFLIPEVNGLTLLSNATLRPVFDAVGLLNMVAFEKNSILNVLRGSESFSA